MIASGQPVGHICDLLGISRFWPELFDVMAGIVTENREEAADDSWENPAIDWDAEFSKLRR